MGMVRNVMKGLAFSFLMICAIRCREETRYHSFYQFKNIKVCRIDFENREEAIFYLEDEPSTFISAHAKGGFDGMMTAYLRFKGNRVEILKSEGSFEKHGNSDRLSLNDIYNRSDSLSDISNYNKMHGGCIYYLSDYVPSEQRGNESLNTKVNAVYDLMLLKKELK